MRPYSRFFSLFFFFFGFNDLLLIEMFARLFFFFFFFFLLRKTNLNFYKYLDSGYVINDGCDRRWRKSLFKV